MRFNDLLHLVAFPWKAHGKPPAPGFVTATKMPESRALSKFSDHFSRYIPLSEGTPCATIHHTMLPDEEEVLPNNMAWALRRFPISLAFTLEGRFLRPARFCRGLGGPRR